MSAPPYESGSADGLVRYGPQARFVSTTKSARCALADEAVRAPTLLRASRLNGP